MDKWIRDKLFSRFSYSDGLVALDLGCGDGSNTVGLAKLGLRVTAVDKQAAMIERTQKLASKDNVVVVTKVAEIQDFQPDTRYDVVLFTHVLHFIPDEDKKTVIQKAVDSVKAGGTLVFADVEDDSPVSTEHLLVLEKSLRDVESERTIVEDEPHLGANYPHQHKVFYLIGIKR